MDTKTLVVGQDVYMLKPPYPFWFCIDEGKVVKVTPEGVDVQVVDLQTADLIRFDTSGKETDVSRRDRLGFGPSEDPFYNSLWHSAPEFGPWHLDDMPFEKRKHLLENQFVGSSLLEEIYKLAYNCSSIP